MGYSKGAYDTARQTLTSRRQEVQSAAALLREEAYLKVPELREIDKKISNSGTSVVKVVMSDPEHAEEHIKKLAEENLALQAKRRALLGQNGFSPDTMDEKFFCHLCKDSGYVGNKICECFEAILKQQAYAQLSKSAPVKNCTFSNFSVNYYSDQSERMSNVLESCKNYAKKFTVESDSLLFIGNTGLGKTHLSLAIAGEVSAAGYGVIYTPIGKLMDTLESEKFSRNSDRRADFTENTLLVTTCDLLVLDDLGTEFSTQFSQSVIYNIVNTRMVESKPTIISTNLRQSELEEKYSQRMTSRLLCNYHTVEFFGKDIRMIKKSKGGN